MIETTLNATLLLLNDPMPPRQRRIPVRKLKQTKRQELYQKLLREQWAKLEAMEFTDPDRCYGAYKTVITQAAEEA